MNFRRLSKISDRSISEKKRAESEVSKLLTNKGTKIKTACILTAQNPNSTKASNNYNRRAKKELSKYLIESHIAFLPIVGRFKENKENGVFIFNISLSLAKYLASRYGQESFIYLTIDDDSYKASYYEKPEQGSRPEDYSLVNSVDKVVPAEDDVYSKLENDFAFTFPSELFTSVVDSLGNFSERLLGVGMSSHAAQIRTNYKAIKILKEYYEL